MSKSVSVKKVTIGESQEGRNMVTAMLGQCYAALKTWGDSASEFETRDAVFQTMLSPYKVDDVRDAFMAHMRTKVDMPTPADIIAQIEPPIEFSHDLYREIQRRAREDHFLTRDEARYISAYEAKYLSQF